MNQFSGFPAKTLFTPIPNLFFSSLLSQINDIAELKITLHIFWSLYGKRGYPRFTTYRELLGNKSLMSGLSDGAKAPDEVLRQVLEMAVKRGTILRVAVVMDDQPEEIYFINTEADRRVAAKILNGELVLAGLKAGEQPQPEAEPAPDIFTLYEQNIGMLTPMIADELCEAEKLYPEGWIIDAIKEAVNHGKRKWSYISAILDSWSVEGKDSGTHKRDFKKSDPDKFSQQKYGHMVKR